SAPRYCSVDHPSAPPALATFPTRRSSDLGDTFTYTLVAGIGDTGNGSFNISGASLRATGSLDHEATPTLSVRVRSSDGGGLWVRSEEHMSELQSREALAGSLLLDK